MHKDVVYNFGTLADGVIGIPCLTDDGQVVEASYFFGDLKPKNIICISSQVSCPMKCSFCELGGEKFIRNLTTKELYKQVMLILTEARKLGFSLANKDHKITIANSGEPFLNPHILEAIQRLSIFGTSFKISTILPRGEKVKERIAHVSEFAENYKQPVQLQISLISTSEEERLRISGGGAADFKAVKDAAALWRSKNPKGRKINLSIILSEESPWNVEEVASLFPPELFRFRFREYVPTVNGVQHSLTPISSEKFLQIKDGFRTKGYEVYDDATPTPTEKKFGLVANSIRAMYLRMVNGLTPDPR